VTNLRGDIISVCDIGMFLELDRAEDDHPRQTVTLRDEKGDAFTSLLVDRVQGIRTFSTREINQTTAPVAVKAARYLRGVYEYEGEVVSILAIDRLFASDEFRMFGGGEV
jgi:chemotaxis signal transduction protein